MHSLNSITPGRSLEVKGMMQGREEKSRGGSIQPKRVDDPDWKVDKTCNEISLTRTSERTQRTHLGYKQDAASDWL